MMRLLAARASELSRRSLRAKAIVFSPHPDDETLACGGTILRKRQSGATVSVVFMTDGGKSHRKFMPTDQLVKLRRAEALAACQQLGVEQHDVSFLDFHDGQLAGQLENCQAQLIELLRRLRPRQVFVPLAREMPTDHAATNRAAWLAIRSKRLSVEVLEYPVWSWCHWPIVQAGKGPRALASSARNAAAACTLEALQFNRRCHVESVLDIKQAALNHYKTQMTRLTDPHWPILSDVENGDWLRMLLGRNEFFRRRVIKASTGR